MVNNVNLKRLSDKDRLILLKYTNACTDIGGNGCSILNNHGKKEKLN